MRTLSIDVAQVERNAIIGRCAADLIWLETPKYISLSGPWREDMEMQQFCSLAVAKKRFLRMHFESMISNLVK